MISPSSASSKSNLVLFVKNGFSDDNRKLFRYVITVPDDQFTTDTNSRMLKVFIQLVLLSLICFHLPSPCSGNAHILASKKIMNEYAVEGKDLTIQYTLYNVGSSVAKSVVLSDDFYSSTEFELIHGLLNSSWDRLPNNMNISHTVILRPLSAGLYNISSASLEYVVNEDGQIQKGYTSSPGYYKIISYPEFARKHSSHITEWIAFVLMATPTMLLPFLLWYSSHSKYEKFVKSKRS